jgi:hypothetical protein
MLIRRQVSCRPAVFAFVLAAIVAVAGLVSGAAAADRAGVVSLELPIGTRGTGLGGAFVSVVDDPTATHWNPAGLARLDVADKRFAILFQHNEWIADFRQEYVGAGTRFGKHAVGGSFSGFYIGDIDGRDDFGNPTVTFGAYDVVVTGSYAYSLNDRTALGGSLKYIVENIDELTEFAFAADLGAQFELRPDLRIGGAVTNLGSGLTFVNEKDDLPTAVQVGGSYVLPWRLGNGSLLAALDVRKASGDDAHVLFGGEYDYAGAARAQIGYGTGYDNTGLSFGLGATVARFDLGYAIVPFDSDLGSTHRFALGFRL